MAANVLAVVPTATGKPDAVFVNGLPGSGKSTAARALAAGGLLGRPASHFAIIDADELRGYHGQVEALFAAGISYESLVSWWQEGSDFERLIFKEPEGLMHHLFSQQLSFIQPAVMATPGSVDWVRYVVEKGYTCHLVVLDVQTDEAASRARARSASTGHWCDPAYVASCAPGLLHNCRALGRTCIESGGTVRIIDNDGPAFPSAALLHAAPLMTAALAEKYGLQAALLAPARVRSLAAALMRRLPDGTLSGVDCCLTGGAFKSLLTCDERDGWAAAQPRDVDIWPLNEADEAALVSRIAAAPGAVAVASRWNTHITLPQPAAPPLVIEVVRAYGRNMSQTLALFDIAICAIGVRFVNGSIVETSVHPLALDSAEWRTLLLLPGARDADYALGTAERLLRSARALNWRATRQLAAIRATYRRASDERRALLLENYDACTLDADDHAAVISLLTR